MLCVDDLLIYAIDDFSADIDDSMQNMFRMHNLRSVAFYLSMNMKLNQEQQMINSHQLSYIWMILV